MLQSPMESKHTKFRVWSHVWTRNQYVSASLKAALPTRHEHTLDAMFETLQRSFLRSFASYHLLKQMNSIAASPRSRLTRMIS